MIRLIIIITILNLISVQTYLGCSAFCLIKKNGCSILCKNLDWPVGYGHITINNRGIEKLSRSNNDEKSFCWVSKYGSITFNQFGKEFPLGGMNEAGLIIEELNHYQTEYFTHPVKNLSEFQWIQYQLDNFGSVEEVASNLRNIGIDKLMSGLHFIISDREGSIAVVEYLKGEPKVFTKNTLEYPILSNNSYQNSIKYLERIGGITDSQNIQLRKGSQERFVYMAYLMNKMKGTSCTSRSNKAFEILDAVKQDDTQWSIVYDSERLEINFTTIDNEKIRTIKFAEFDFSSDETLVEEIISTRDEKLDSKLNFIPYHKLFNDNLINSVIDKMITSNIIDYKKGVEYKSFFFKN